MLRTGQHHTTHHTDIDASPDTVYRIIANASAWPLSFAPTIHVEQTPLDAATERLRIWATANGEVKTWTSLRTLDADDRRIEFRQEVSSPPVAFMSGVWKVESHAPGPLRLLLDHDFGAVDDAPDSVEWIKAATDRNSATELANIKELAETADAAAEATFDFEDSTLIQGDEDQVYRFLHEAAKWPERLPHVSRMRLREDVENIQWMAMDTITKDGSEHTTESVRICLPQDRLIVYKQLVTPPLMATHIGRWTVRRTEDGVAATSWHGVRINVSAIETVLGPDATIASAREFVRRAVGGNSAATLGLAKEFAEEHHG